MCKIKNLADVFNAAVPLVGRQGGGAQIIVQLNRKKVRFLFGFLHSSCYVLAGLVFNWDISV